ncbi:MAG: NodT family efflux transporter outer membrane factor (OMF) lipoprotein [Myxococcota bacterium]|jgi:NodT family efflux transporter outer membrane factor (OMF) lipoprotein
MSSARMSNASLIISLLLLLNGCTVYSAVDRAAAPLAMPDGFSTDQSEGTIDAHAAGNRWWTRLADDALDAFVDHVLSQNLDLAGAYTRVAQAEATRRAAGAGGQPQVSIGFNPSGAYSGAFESGGSAGQTNVPLTASLDYEFDVWGKYRHQRTAAAFDAAAARLDVESTAQRVVGDVVSAWLDRSEQLALGALIEAQLKNTRTLLRVIELRFANGQAGAADVLAQRQQVAALESQLPPITGRVKVSEHRLAILAGQPPGTAVAGFAEGLPAPPPLPRLGIPGELLRRRPDIRAAERRVAAADHRVGVAVADRYPSFRVGLSMGFGADTLTNFFKQWIVNLSAAIAAPLLDGGRRSAEVERANAQTHELLTIYAKTILAALGEVEDAVAQERAQRALLVKLDLQVEVAALSLKTAEASFREGQGDFTAVLGAQQSVLSVQQSRLSASRRLLTLRTSLYRALGGDWSAELAPVAPPVLKAEPTTPKASR